jgi:hypothetical protein
MSAGRTRRADRAAVADSRAQLRLKADLLRIAPNLDVRV